LRRRPLTSALIAREDAELEIDCRTSGQERGGGRGVALDDVELVRLLVTRSKMVERNGEARVGP